MHNELIRKINDNTISTSNYFTMDPFSYTNDAQFGKIENEINFFEDMYVITSKTFERLALLAKIAKDDSINAVIVTGYSGSGKTNFLKFCEALINDKVKMKNYNVVKREIEKTYNFKDLSDKTNGDSPTFFDEILKEKSVSETKIINDRFNHSINEIIKTLSSQCFSKNKNDTKKMIADYLNETLKGTTVFIDFDKDKQDSEKPLPLRLIRSIENHLSIQNSENIKQVYNFYKSNENEFKKAFEGCINYYFDEALELIYNNCSNKFINYRNEFNNAFNRLQIDQLLCIEILLKVSEMTNKKPINLYYFLDNIDVISGDDNQVLINSITKFWDYIRQIKSFLQEIRNKEGSSEIDKKWIESLEKIKYIFSMRETTAMHIGDHLRNRISAYSKHIDISLDIDKSFIFKKRFDLLKKYINEHKIINESFIEMAKCIETITEDKFFKWTLFELFNNDYRKAVECLCQICDIKTNSVYSSLSLIKDANPYIKFGGRGVIIKSICDSFKNWNYFSDLGIPMLENRVRTTHNITLNRLILTVLTNMQKAINPTNQPSFFIRKENCVSLKKLYENVQLFCDQKVFLSCIKGMFSGRNWSYWNHLITFDNILEYSEKELLEALNEDTNAEVYIRCTKAGERYLNTICVHYEFFASRFATCNKSGLFSQSISKTNEGYSFEKQIKEVIESVRKCCNNIKEINNKIISSLQENGSFKFSDILNSCYVRREQFHEERIIHNHITYLDSFRLYLINGSQKNDIHNINKCLIKYIKAYLELLKIDGGFYSLTSGKLYTELNFCIDKIIEKNYNDKEIIISSTYYSEKIDSKKFLI